MTTKTKNKLYSISNSALSQLFPDRCAICEEIVDVGRNICSDCNQNFCRKPEKFYVGRSVCYSVCEYNEKNKRIVLGAKKGRDFHKLCFMADEIYELLKNFGIIDEIDAIIPVPASFAKIIKRGFNHTDKMARHLSYLSGIDVMKAVRKIRETNEQKSLTRSERIRNLKDCYIVNKRSQISNKTVLLIDDVTTTGSTLKEIAALLEKDGNRVICAVFARTPYKEKSRKE